MNRHLLPLLAASILVIAAAGQVRAAQPVQNHAAIKAAVDEYLRVQTGGLPGQIELIVGAVDPRLALPTCAALDVFTPPGARLWGRSNVGVRCASPAAWTIYVPVTVRVTGTYLVATRNLTQGHTIGVNDYTAITGDLTQMPSGVAQDPEQVLGRSVTGPLAAGQAVRTDLLRAPTVIQQGQSVKLVARGKGFEVTSEGKALSQGLLGQVVQVRSPSGQTISGIARSGGLVEIGN